MTERLVPYAPLFDAFAAADHELYAVGGCVRDLVMGLPDRSDYDFTTSARPDDIERILRRGGFRVFPIGARFGTIATLVGDTQVEITTYRANEVYDEGSRHPEVVFGDELLEDLGRRDLSMNAMAMGLDGVIVDPYDGQRAIRNGVLEVPGGGYENTISILRDDPLRLLRIARFSARFGFRPTADTTRAAGVTAAALDEISRERWKMEFDKLLATRHVGEGLLWLHETRALGVVLPRLVDMGDLEAERLVDRLHRLPADATMRWAIVVMAAASGGADVLATDKVTRAAVRDIATRFRFSNDETKRVHRLVDVTLDPVDLTTPWPAARLRRWVDEAGDDAEDRLRVRAAWTLDAGVVEAAEDRVGELQDLRATEDPVPRMPKGLGDAIRVHFDLDRGPAIGRAMRAVREALLDGELANPPSIEACVAWLASKGDL